MCLALIESGFGRLGMYVAHCYLVRWQEVYGFSIELGQWASRC